MCDYLINLVFNIAIYLQWTRAVATSQLHLYRPNILQGVSDDLVHHPKDG